MLPVQAHPSYMLQLKMVEIHVPIFVSIRPKHLKILKMYRAMASML